MIDPAKSSNAREGKGISGSWDLGRGRRETGPRNGKVGWDQETKKRKGERRRGFGGKMKGGCGGSDSKGGGG